MNNTSNLKINSNVGVGRSGTVTVTGPEGEVNEWRERYFRSYHPCGYGTYERSRKANADGTVTVVVWRSHSCD